MKEKIYTYLLNRDDGVSPATIMEEFFCTLNAPSTQTEKIIDSILMGDARFAKDDQGNWQAVQQNKKSFLHEISFNLVELGTVPLNSKKELPVLLGIARVKNDQLVDKRVLSLRLPAPLTIPLTQKIAHMRIDEKIEEKFENKIGEIYRQLNQGVWVSFSPNRTIHTLNWFFREYSYPEVEAEKISLKEFARKMMPGQVIRSLEDIAHLLEIPYYSPLSFPAKMELMVEIFVELLIKAKEKSILRIDDLTTYLQDVKEWVNFQHFNFNKAYIMDLPDTPGVYLMRNKKGRIFYVGKAKKLKSRVESYFVNRVDMDEKGKIILSELYELSYEPVGSELDALLLENKYIRQYQPELNAQIAIHRKDGLPHRDRKIILFLPAIDNNQVKLILLDGAENATHLLLDRSHPDLKSCEKSVKTFFFSKSEKEALYTPEQIEIIWRWLTLNDDKVNYLNVDHCGEVTNCMEMIIAYLNDEKLLSEKIHFHIP